MVIQIGILLLLLVVLPLFTGGLVVQERTASEALPLRWISGQFLLWAGFQFICVPMIMKEKNFYIVVALYGMYIAALLLMTCAVEMRRRAKSMTFRLLRGEDMEKRLGTSLLWLLFGMLLLFQLVQAVRLAYADGDDAFYVAVSTITDNAETMYQKLPYTGGGTQLDIRHGLAPFPIWISFLSRVSGMPAVTTAHVALPVVLIPMTYAIFYLMGCRLFPDKDERLPLFLVFTELLVLFGDYSFYTAENFMLARSRQGKAALGSIVIPFALYLLLWLLQTLQEKERPPLSWYVLLLAATMTACMCSTLGALLLCMLIGITGLAGAVCYRQRHILLPMALCCSPCVCYAFLYLVFG